MRVFVTSKFLIRCTLKIPIQHELVVMVDNLVGASHKIKGTKTLGIKKVHSSELKQKEQCAAVENFLRVQ